MIAQNFAQITEKQQVQSFVEKLGSRWDWREKCVLADVVRESLNNGITARDIIGAGVFKEIDESRIYIFWRSGNEIIAFWFEREWFREQAHLVKSRKLQQLVVVSEPNMMALIATREVDAEGIPVDWEVLPLDIARNLTSWGWRIADTWQPVSDAENEVAMW
ncbi:MAG: hypothetical protein KME30_19005 [Iphinoe sp. HA4291-MV1]|jgi:hypothetical protein|nr:hypothetical protein [Iphinoe sp. HA4291-MV1]